MFCNHAITQFYYCSQTMCGIFVYIPKSTKIRPSTFIPKSMQCDTKFKRKDFSTIASLVRIDRNVFNFENIATMCATEWHGTVASKMHCKCDGGGQRGVGEVSES